MEMVAVIVVVCITELYLAKMMYRISGKPTYNNDKNKQLLYKATITGLQFISILVALVGIIVAALISGYIK